MAITCTIWQIANATGLSKQTIRQRILDERLDAVMVAGAYRATPDAVRQWLTDEFSSADRVDSAMKKLEDIMSRGNVTIDQWSYYIGQWTALMLECGTIIFKLLPDAADPENSLHPLLKRLTPILTNIPTDPFKQKPIDEKVIMQKEFLQKVGEIADGIARILQSIPEESMDEQGEFWMGYKKQRSWLESGQKNEQPDTAPATKSEQGNEPEANQAGTVESESAEPAMRAGQPDYIHRLLHECGDDIDILLDVIREWRKQAVGGDKFLDKDEVAQRLNGDPALLKQLLDKVKE